MATSQSGEQVPEPLEPVSATARVFELLGEDATSVQEFVTWLADRTRAIVPSLVGISIAFMDQDMTLTLATSELSLRDLDAAQYLEDGPCEEAVRRCKPVVSRTADPMDEDRWTLFALTGAQRGVLSSLSLPLVVGGEVVGGVNLYAADVRAFDDRVDAVADLVGSRAEAAIRDADLTLTSFRRAVRTMHSVEDRMTMDIAAGIVAERNSKDPTQAMVDLQEAANRAGVPAVQLALLVIELYERPDGP